MKIYETERDLEALVDSFERGTIADKDWRHAEHLAVALFYLSRHDFETALRKMRDGIFNLLRAFKVDLAKEMPYHETLTVFWMRTVDEFRKSKNGAPLAEICRELVEKFDKNYPFVFYSREHLFSERARREFVEADL
ncbi:MAG TPA: hypothetical protein VIL74_06470 [Pyrinomonadaceae bacterium]|jgi:nitrate reductase assembly molybdenum cofactor insertion protein NarJ